MFVFVYFFGIDFLVVDVVLSIENVGDDKWNEDRNIGYGFECELVGIIIGKG